MTVNSSAGRYRQYSFWTTLRDTAPPIQVKRQSRPQSARGSYLDTPSGASGSAMHTIYPPSPTGTRTHSIFPARWPILRMHPLSVKTSLTSRWSGRTRQRPGIWSMSAWAVRNILRRAACLVWNAARWLDARDLATLMCASFYSCEAARCMSSSCQTAFRKTWISRAWIETPRQLRCNRPRDIAPRRLRSRSARITRCEASAARKSLD